MRVSWRIRALKRAFIKEVLKLPDEFLEMLDYSEDGSYIYLHPRAYLGERFFAMVCSRFEKFNGRYVRGGLGVFMFRKEPWW